MSSPESSIKTVSKLKSPPPDNLLHPQLLTISQKLMTFYVQEHDARTGTVERRTRPAFLFKFGFEDRLMIAGPRNCH